MHCIILQETGRIHFNCSTLEGVQLEDQGGSGTALSHWESRILEVHIIGVGMGGGLGGLQPPQLFSKKGLAPPMFTC